MTVSMQVSKRIYAGNGVTRQWEVDFPLASPQDVRVYLTSPAGAEEELTADFELNSAGTELVYPTLSSGKPPLAEGWSLTLERQTPLTQEIDLLRQGELDAEVLENGYDKLTLLVQELNEKVARSIKYPVSTTAEDLETDTFLRNILSIKQDALNASASALTSAQEALSSSNSAVASAQDAQASALSALETAQNALAAISSSQAAAQDEIAATGLNLENALQTYLSAAQEEAETARYYAERSVGKTVGEVYFSQSSLEADNPGALPLFTGDIIASADTLYPDFYAWLQTRTDLQCSPEEYQAALTSFGECPKYVLEEGSLRLPLLKNYIKMAESAVEQGRLAAASSTTGTSGSGYTTLYPWVFAYHTAVAASVAQAGEFLEALQAKANADLGNVAENIDYVVESYFDASGNWYRKYKSGWLEQGGLKTPRTYVTYLKPFGSKFPYPVVSWSYPTGSSRGVEVYDASRTGFNARESNNGGITSGNSIAWYVFGKGE